MIIIQSSHNFNTISSSLSSSIQKFYNNTINQLNLNSLQCPDCDNLGFYYHAYYMRHIYIFQSKFPIIITRIICKHCGKTHAILIDDMLPFSQLSANTILALIKSLSSNFLDLSHLSFLIFKYSNVSNIYHDLCLFNARSFHCIFIST